MTDSPLLAEIREPLTGSIITKECQSSRPDRLGSNPDGNWNEAVALPLPSRNPKKPENGGVFGWVSANEV